jgi:DNA-binding transcriptional LysR family regulator
MNINQLKYFNAVYTYRSVSKAADILHISQPSLSNSIKELEHEFDVVLFSRFHGGMEPTIHAETLYNLSKDLLLKAEQMQRIMRDVSKDNKVIRFGVPPMIGSLFLSGIYKNMGERLQDVKLHIIEGGREELLKKLNDNQVDMIFIPYNDLANSALTVKHIAKLEIACCVSGDNKLSKKPSIIPPDLKNVPLVLFDDSYFQTDKIKKWFSESSTEPNIILQTQQLSTIQSFVSDGVAAGFLFKEMSKKSDNIVYISARDKIYADVSLVWKKENYFSDMLKKFGEFVSDINEFYH